jgi:hypothetical protein
VDCTTLTVKYRTLKTFFRLPNNPKPNLLFIISDNQRLRYLQSESSGKDVERRMEVCEVDSRDELRRADDFITAE